MTAQTDAQLWYKDAVIYEVHVRAFFDSNGDGIGDFRGLTQKLDYLQDLGVTAIWVLPFYPSPLKDDGYDIADYSGVHASYGSVRDFKLFLREAHRRGLKVISEMVLNHTSDQHPWFLRARRSPPGSPARDFYVWSDTPDRYKEARIIFKDFESSNWSWDPQAKAYYWHRFYSHQPDLNFDNPLVRKTMLELVDYWLAMGVDGMRLDAVPYLYEREGTSCENLPETHDFLKELRAHIDARFENRMLLAEANQWPEDAVAYFGGGDESHMAFHFPLMPRMFMSVRMEDRFPFIDILQQTPPVPDACSWALFLRNHDELTLEMVTDEERDYMYRVYAHDPQMRINLGIRRRLAPLLGNNRRQIELMNGLLFSLPGTPVIYYGDEIGMGDNIYLGDRNGVRTPMQWSADRNAGFSRANPQRLYLPVIIDPEYHAEALNVEAQQNNPHSFLWWMKRLIALRRRHRAFGRGTLEFLYPENRKVLAFVRAYGDERILVVANLSRFVQSAELDLSAFKGAVPVEMFGQTEFPPVGELPYFVTLGPHAFYWFLLAEPAEPEALPAHAENLPAIALRGPLDADSLVQAAGALTPIMPRFLVSRRWFGGKARRIKTVSIDDLVSIPADRPAAILFLHVEYAEGDPQEYVLPVAIASGAEADRIREDYPGAAIARAVIDTGEDALLYDALFDPGFARALLEQIVRRRRTRGRRGEVIASLTRPTGGNPVQGVDASALTPSIMRAEQTNTSVVFGDRTVLKLFRRMEDFVNPDLQIGRFLTEQRDFHAVPKVCGAIEYRRGAREPATLGILHEFVPNQGDAWAYTLDTVRAFLDEVMARTAGGSGPRIEASYDLIAMAEEDPPAEAHQMIGAYLESARLLGQRTAELHLVLASEGEDPQFTPEPFTPFYQRSIYQSMRSMTRRVFVQLRNPHTRPAAAAQIIDLEDDMLRRFARLLDRSIDAVRIRCHGDFHLGQVLYTGKDFVIIDFEGEPDRSISARRIKRSPLVDVAGMLRSFHYAAYTALVGRQAGLEAERSAELEPWVVFWQRWVSASFLRAYLDVADGHPIVPRAREDLRLLLDAFTLEKAVYELGYELNNRPDWVTIPIHGIVQLMES